MASAILLTVVMSSASADLASAAYGTNQFTDNFYEDNLRQMNDRGYVVWKVRDVSDAEISPYDAETRTQPIDDFIDDYVPEINHKGYVVWKVRDVSDAEISPYDAETRTQPTDNSIDDYVPEINHKGYVVWKERGHDGSDHEILIAELEPDYSAAANVDAASYGLRFLTGSGVFIGLTLALLLVGGVIVLKILRKKEPSPSRARRAPMTNRCDIRSA